MFRIRTLLLTLSLLLFSNTLSAFYIGPDGAAYTKDGVVWTPVKYEEEDCGVKAKLPGKVKTGVDDTYIYAESRVNKTSYLIMCEFSTRYCLPKSENAFLRHIKSAFKGEKVEISLISSDKKNIRYIAEVKYLKKELVMRFYASHNQLYFACTEGKDKQLAPEFFNSIEVIK